MVLFCIALYVVIAFPTIATAIVVALSCFQKRWGKNEVKLITIAIKSNQEKKQTADTINEANKIKTNTLKGAIENHQKFYSEKIILHFGCTNIIFANLINKNKKLRKLNDDGYGNFAKWHF